MNNRFKELFRLPPNLYIEGAPIVIVAGSLLKDSVSENLVVQMKFQSIIDKTIKAIILDIISIDITGKEISEHIEYQYLDLDIKNGQEFGANKAIIIPDSVVRSFRINSITAIFIDDQKWICNEPFNKLPDVITLEDALQSKELSRQYKLNTNQYAMYKPFECFDLWHCSCGLWNKTLSCVRCSLKKTIVFEEYNVEKLIKETNVRLAEEEEQARVKEERERVQKENQNKKIEEKKKKIKKILKIFTVFLGVVVGLYLLGLYIYHYHWIPHCNNVKYEDARNFIDKQEYDSAIEIFIELGDYKDSCEKIMLCKYEQAMLLIDAAKYNEAIEILQSITSYSDSEKKIELAENYIKYNEAVVLLEDLNNYESAKIIFDKLDDYEEFENLCRETCLRYADECLSKKDYYIAIEIYEKYNALDDNYKKACYDIAVKLLDHDLYRKSITYFSKIPNYLDSEEKLNTAIELEKQLAIYNTAQKYFELADFDLTLEQLNQLPLEYEDTLYMKNICEKYKNIAGRWKCIKYMSYDGWATEEYIIKEHDIFVSVDLDEQIWVKGSGYDQKSYRASLSGNVLTWSENQSFNIGTKKYYHNGNCYAEYTKE